jgi:hypothetical protein
LPFANDHFAITAGVGPYFYYDTRPLPNGETENVHGTAPIYTLTGTAYFSSRWYLTVLFNRVKAQDLRTTTGALGVGFWFGQDVRPKKGELGDNPDVYHYVTDPEITVFIGQSIVNTFLSESARAYGAEYRQGIFPHIDATATMIHEGDPEIVRRNGLAFQVWGVNTFHNERVSVGVGIGPYIYIDQKHPQPGRFGSSAALAPLVSFTVATRMSEHWVARLVFNRVTTSYNRDADVIFLGLGYRFGHPG